MSVELRDRLEGALGLLVFSDSPEPAPLSLAEAGRALAHQVRKLSLLSLHDQLPAWEGEEGRALAASAVDAAAAVCMVARARASGGCRALQDSLRASVSAAVCSAAAFAAVLPPPGEAGAPRAVVTAATAAACEAAEALARLPSSGRVATGRALVAAGARVKDAAREAREMCRAGAEAEESDSDSCDYQEAATEEETRLVAASLPLLDSSLRLLAPLLRCVSAEGAEAAGPLDECLERYRRLAELAEDYTAALWPPHEPRLLLQHAAALAAAASALPAAATGAAGGLEREGAEALAREADAVAEAARRVTALLAAAEDASDS